MRFYIQISGLIYGGDKMDKTDRELTPEEVELYKKYGEITAGKILDKIRQDYETNIQNRMDDFARTLTYDGMLSACTYATSTVDMYRIEGQYCVDARDMTWAKAYDLLSAILPTVQAGGEIPTWEEIEAQLPPLAWPEGSRGWQPPAESEEEEKPEVAEE